MPGTIMSPFKEETNRTENLTPTMIGKGEAEN
jgi:hypothetical protein